MMSLMSVICIARYIKSYVCLKLDRGGFGFLISGLEKGVGILSR